MRLPYIADSKRQTAISGPFCGVVAPKQIGPQLRGPIS